jgi:hypothetical protein
VPRVVGDTRIRNVGVRALAREVGLAEPTVTIKLNRGMTPDQIREQQAVKRRVGKAGLTDQENGKSTGKKTGKEDSGFRSYSPSNPKAGKMKEPTAVVAPSPAPPLVPPPTKVVAEVGPDTVKQRESFYEARERKEIALANEKELMVMMRRGDVAPIVQVNAWFSGCIIKARDILLRMGPELRDRLAAEVDPVECEKLILAEIERALEAMRLFPVSGFATGETEDVDERIEEVV